MGALSNAGAGVSMSMSQGFPRKRYSLFILAILSFLLGGVALYIGSHNFAIRSIGLLAILISTYLVRISRVHSRYGLSVEGGQEANYVAIRRPGRFLWGSSIALLLLAGVSFLYLYHDALHGYQEVLPVYIFAGVGVVCTLVWSYLLLRIFK